MKKNTFFLIALLLVVFSGCVFAQNKKSKTTSKIIKITDKSYLTEIEKGVVLVDFWASWCGPCRKMNPILEELATEQAANLKIGKVNVDDYKALSKEYNIQSIPTMILYKDGKELTRFVGTYSKDELQQEITDALK